MWLCGLNCWEDAENHMKDDHLRFLHLLTSCTRGRPRGPAHPVWYVRWPWVQPVGHAGNVRWSTPHWSNTPLWCISLKTADFSIKWRHLIKPMKKRSSKHTQIFVSHQPSNCTSAVESDSPWTHRSVDSHPDKSDPECLMFSSCSAVLAASCGPSWRSSSSSCSGSSPACRSSSTARIFQPAAVFSSRLQNHRECVRFHVKVLDSYWHLNMNLWERKSENRGMQNRGNKRSYSSSGRTAVPRDQLAPAAASWTEALVPSAGHGSSLPAPGSPVNTYTCRLGCHIAVNCPFHLDRVRTILFRRKCSFSFLLSFFVFFSCFWTICRQTAALYRCSPAPQFVDIRGSFTSFSLRLMSSMNL